MLAGLMPQGSVLPLDLIGSEGARVFRKKVAISGVFLFLGTRIGPMLVSRAGCPGRSAFVDDLGSVLPPPWSRAFSLAASAGALALIPSPHQLYCGIMIRTVSKEL